MAGASITAQTLQSVAANQADMSQVALQPAIRSLSNGIAGVERRCIATPLLRRLGSAQSGTLLVNSLNYCGRQGIDSHP